MFPFLLKFLKKDSRLTNQFLGKRVNAFKMILVYHLHLLYSCPPSEGSNFLRPYYVVSFLHTLFRASLYTDSLLLPSFARLFISLLRLRWGHVSDLLDFDTTWTCRDLSVFLREERVIERDVSETQRRNSWVWLQKWCQDRLKPKFDEDTQTDSWVSNSTIVSKHTLVPTQTCTSLSFWNRNKHHKLHRYYFHIIT